MYLFEKDRYRRRYLPKTAKFPATSPPRLLVFFPREMERCVTRITTGNDRMTFSDRARVGYVKKRRFLSRTEFFRRKLLNAICGCRIITKRRKRTTHKYILYIYIYVYTFNKLYKTNARFECTAPTTVLGNNVWSMHVYNFELLCRRTTR